MKHYLAQMNPNRLPPQPRVNNIVNTSGHNQNGNSVSGLGELQLVGLDNNASGSVPHKQNDDELAMEGIGKPNGTNIIPGGGGDINGSNKLKSETSYEKWNQEDVLKWIRRNLDDNSIDNERIESFLDEFSQKYVTGKMLTQLKHSERLIDDLKSQFSKENQIFGLWLVVKTAILTVGDVPPNTDDFSK